MKSNNVITNRAFWVTRNPELFNANFQLLLYIIDAIFIIYALSSVPLYVFYHFFGNLGLFTQNRELYELDANLRQQYEANYTLNNNSLFWNIFNNIFLLFFVVLSQSIIRNQTFSHFFLFFGILNLFIFGYFMNVNLTLIPNNTSFIYNIFHYMLLLASIMIIIYLYKHFSKKNTPPNQKSETGYGKYKYSENSTLRMEDVVHEVNLRLDMAKMRFNSFLIKLKLNKILKKFMFQPKDYYFMKNQYTQESEVNKVVNNIKGNNDSNEKNNKKVNNRSNVSDTRSTNIGSNFSMDNSYSRLDDDDEEEINPLKK